MGHNTYGYAHHSQFYNSMKAILNVSAVLVILSLAAVLNNKGCKVTQNLVKEQCL